MKLLKLGVLTAATFMMKNGQMSSLRRHETLNGKFQMTFHAQTSYHTLNIRSVIRRSEEATKLWVPNLQKANLQRENCWQNGRSSVGVTFIINGEC